MDTALGGLSCQSASSFAGAQVILKDIEHLNTQLQVDKKSDRRRMIISGLTRH